MSTTRDYYTVEAGELWWNVSDFTKYVRWQCCSHEFEFLENAVKYMEDCEKSPFWRKHKTYRIVHWTRKVVITGRPLTGSQFEI